MWEFFNSLLGVAPRLRCANDGALELRGVWLMPEDSEPTAAKGKPPEVVTRSTLAVKLGMKASGDIGAV